MYRDTCHTIYELFLFIAEYILDRNECPLQRERQWSDPDNCRFELRWRNERLIEWRNSLAQQSSKQTISEVSHFDKGKLIYTG